MTTMKKNSLVLKNETHGKIDATRSGKEDHHCFRSNVRRFHNDWSHHLQEDYHPQGRLRKRGANHVSSTIASYGGGNYENEDKILLLIENKNSCIATRPTIWDKEDIPPLRCCSSACRRHINRSRDRTISLRWGGTVCLLVLVLPFVTGTATTTPILRRRTATAAFCTPTAPNCICLQRKMNEPHRRKILQTQTSCSLGLMKLPSTTSSSTLLYLIKNNNRIRNSHSTTSTTSDQDKENTTTTTNITTTKDVIQGSNPANSSLNQPRSVNVVREDAVPLGEIKKSNANHLNPKNITVNVESHRRADGSHSSNRNGSHTMNQQRSTTSKTISDGSTYPATKKLSNNTSTAKEVSEEDSKESIVDAIGRLAGGLLPSSGDDDDDDKKENNKLQPQSLSDQSSDTSNPFDWRSSMNRLSFGGNEEVDEQKERRRRRKRHTSKERYQINPEEAKELDKSVVPFSSTDDAMMGLQVLPTTLSPTVVVASSTTKKPSTSTTTPAATQDSTSSTLGEKLSKRRLIKQWTKEVLQSSPSSTEKKNKGDDRRANNSSKAAADTLKDDVMLGGGRIHRDLREVAVSIASNIDTIDQYKVFHSEGGSTSSTTGDDGSSGPLQQIFQSLKVSARLINVASEQSTELSLSSTTMKHKIPSTPEGFYYYYCGTGGGGHVATMNGAVQSHSSGISMEDVDHAFATACTACRALRDLCALSPELSSVITEAILDASTAASSSSTTSSTVADLTTSAAANVPGGVVAALASLLNYSIEKSNQAVQRHHYENNNHGFMGAPQPHNHNHQGSSTNTYSNLDDTISNPTTKEEDDSFVIPATTSSLMEEKARLCQLYVIQLCLAMTLSSDAAVYTLRQIPSLKHSIMKCSSYANYHDEEEQTSGSNKRKAIWNLFRKRSRQETVMGSPSQTSSSQQLQSQPPQQRTMIMEQHDVIPVMDGTFDGRLRGASNQLLAALGYNVWVPKQPLPLEQKKRRGLRILCIDGGGTRGIAAITSLQQIVRSLGGIEICESFDIVAGTSTGAIISFLVALRRETSNMTRKRYDMLIKRIFVKSPLSTPMLVFTTASYDESHFMTVMDEILGDDSMLESRVHPHGPYVFAVSTKMSSTPTTVCLFRNYNYSGGELPDSFVIPPQQAKQELELLNDNDEDNDDGSDMTFLQDEYNDDEDDDYDDDYFDDDYDDNDRRSMTTNHDGSKRAMKNMLVESTRISTGGSGGSRNPGSFRIPQKVALRATTAAPTVFKPILMGGELYCDGGMLASNPTAIAIHEARTLFPDIPIDCVVSLGTGGFREVKSSPRIGWDGIITQIVNSATDAEQPHHILEDILGQGSDSSSGTKYFRFNPMIGLPDDFPLDNTDPKSLEDLSRITQRYMEEPIQKQKLLELSNIMIGGEEDLNEQRQKGFLRRLLPF